MLKGYRALTLAACLALLGGSGWAEEIFAVTTSNTLIRFDSSDPSKLLSSVALTGLQSSETILGIDFRPATGQLYALGSTSRLYIITPGTGATTQVGTGQFTTLLNGTRFGFDFNPSADAVRITSDKGQNLRVSPNTGAIAVVDTALALFDQPAGTTPNVVGSAYNNNFSGTGTTTLYDIDSNLDALLIQNPPNNGTLTTVGGLGVDSTDQVGFDISGVTAIAYAALQVTGETTSTLFTVNLVNGFATEVGGIGSTEVVVDIAVPTAPVQAGYAVTTGAAPILIKFNVAFPATTIGTSPSITGLAATVQNIVGIDFRPANGKLYALTSNGNAGTGSDPSDDYSLYTIDTATGAATSVGSFALPNANSSPDFDIDFNPVVDRLRVITNGGNNYRINPDTVAVTVDTNVAYVSGDANFGTSPTLIGAAYNNNVAGATSTTLFALDTLHNTDQLVSFTNPNGGTIASIGTGTGFNDASSTQVGLDINSDGDAYMMIRLAGVQTLYSVNLSTGAALVIGSMSSNSIRDFAIPTASGGGSTANPGVLSFSSSTYQVVEGSTASIVISRTGGSSGTVSVQVVTTNGNATADSDYTFTSQTVSFADGETSRTVFIPALTDATQELFETVGLALVNVTGTTIGSPSTAILTIADIDDLDGDGFSNEEEIAAGTDPNSASSTPFGGAPAGTVNTTDLTVTKVSVKLNFLKAASDAISLSGTIGGLSDTLTLKDQKVVVTFGGISKSLTLTDKGKAVSTDKKDSITIGKPKNGVSKFSFKFNKGDFDTDLADEGLADDPDSPSKAPRTVLIKIFFANKNLQKTQNLVVTIKSGKGSSASAPRK